MLLISISVTLRAICHGSIGVTGFVVKVWLIRAWQGQVGEVQADKDCAITVADKNIIIGHTTRVPS